MNGNHRTLAHRLAAILLAFGVASGMGHGVAWADGGDSGPASGTVHSSQADNGSADTSKCR